MLNHFNFGGGLTSSLLHPAVVFAMILAIISMFLLSRKFVVIPFLLSILLIPLGQQLVVAGVHLFVARILILVGCVRLAASKYSSPEKAFAQRVTTLDKAFLAWAIFRAASGILYYQEKGALINQAGFLWDALGGYFLLRFLIQNDEDIERVIKVFAFVAIISGAAMLSEHFTGRSAFGFLGGIRQILELRNGTPRAMGPFQHALLAGTFGATLPPLFIWLWKGGKSKLLASVGMVGCTLMSSLTMCSSPVLVYVAGMGAICLWPFRNHMRIFRWGIVFTCILLQLFMHAPFWFVLSHIDLVGGSSGWYRAALIDNFLRHFDQWWLIGTNANMSWAAGAMWDACNQFVAEGIAGGLLTLVLFIGMISICFRSLGGARKSVEGQRNRRWFFWLLGATLFAHVVGFFGIDYFDQTKFAWYALLAIITAATGPVLIAKTTQELTPQLSVRQLPAFAVSHTPLSHSAPGGDRLAQTKTRAFSR